MQPPSSGKRPSGCNVVSNAKTIDANRAREAPAKMAAMPTKPAMRGSIPSAGNNDAPSAPTVAPRPPPIVNSGAKVPPDVARQLSHALTTGITSGTRGSLLIAAGFVTFGAFMSLLIPRVQAFDADTIDLTIDRVEIVPDRPAPAPAH